MSTRSRLAPLAVVLLVSAVGAAQPGQPGKAPPTEIPTGVVPRDAAGFVSLNVARVWDHKALLPVRDARGKVEFAWVVQSLLGVGPADIDRLVVFWKTPDRPFVLVVGRKPIDTAVVLESTARAGSKPPAKPADPRILLAPGAEFPYVAKVNDRTVLLAPAGTDPAELARMLDQPRGGLGAVTGAVESAGKHDLVVGLDVRAIADLPLPVGPPLLEAKTAILTADLVTDQKAAAKLTLTFATPEKAKAVEPVLRAKLTELAGYAAAMEKKSYEKSDDSGSLPGPLFEWVATTLKAAKVKADGTSLVAAAEFDLSDAVNRVMLAAPDAALADRGPSPATNNLKQVGLAIHSYHDVNNHCPANSYDKDGKPLLSWRVHILPYIEQQALYNQFKLDEPWDSEHNKPLSKVVIKAYTVPGRPTEPGLTYFQSFVKPKGSTDPFNPWLTEGQSKGPMLAAVPDGTSNTVMVAEATEPVVWSKPDDLVYGEKLPLPKLGGPSGRYTLLFGDGSVRAYRRGQIDETNLRRIITRDDGQVVNIP
ncbi:MAG: DUF1559 domain-containing protein [Gemmataceae bacterium]|nr:DUF1559 domain-containing protein [Gemmataceae bacterium]